MISPAQYAFNLFFTSAFSFLAGLAVVWGAVRFFRIEQGRWKLFLFASPFVKIIWDLIYTRIPENSVVYSGFDPLKAPSHGNIFSIGAGLSEYGPRFNLMMFEVTTPDGKKYTLGIADYLFSLMSKYLGHKSPSIILGAALAVSLFLLVRRIWAAKEFESVRSERRTNDKTLGQLFCGNRKVDIYRSSHYAGSPFTGGILKPYICFPDSAFESLSDEQRQAVIQHELGHIRQWDLLGTWFVKIMGDLFWFVPFYRSLSRRIDRLREILADQYAVSAGVARESLASALLALESSKTENQDTVIYSAFFREKKLLRLRVEKLIGQNKERAPRFGWSNPWLKVPAAAFIVVGVLSATLGGNHSAVTTPGLPPEMQAAVHFIQTLFHQVSLWGRSS
jgi:hypothetical protein